MLAYLVEIVQREMEDAGDSFFAIRHLGSTVAVTNEAGETVWTSEYTPFDDPYSSEEELAHAAKFIGRRHFIFDMEISPFRRNDPFYWAM
jgi:hypothetical protein